MALMILMALGVAEKAALSQPVEKATKEEEAEEAEEEEEEEEEG
jgi:hypothetical protein